MIRHLRGYTPFSGTPLGCQNVYQNFHRTIPLNHLKKKNPEKIDPPSLERLLKAKNLFLPCNFFAFWSSPPQKLGTMVSCHRYHRLSPCYFSAIRIHIFDVWTKNQDKLPQIWLFSHLGKTAKKLKSCIYGRISQKPS